MRGPVDWGFFQGAKHEEVRVHGVVHTTSPELAVQLATAGVGILRTSEWTVRDELRRGRLVGVMPTWRCHRVPKGGVPVYVMYT